MDLGLEVGNRQTKMDSELVRELVQARDMNLLKHKQIKEAVEKDKSYAGFPVVSLGRQSIHEVQEIHERTVRELTKNARKLRAFGAAINLDGSLAANIDRASGKAKREGLDTKGDLAYVRKVTLDHTQVYRNSTDIEKDMGISREAMYRVDTPDRAMVDSVLRDVVIKPLDNLDDYISIKYAKWNDKADKEREEREKELLLQDRERRDRETREEIEYDYFPNALGR